MGIASGPISQGSVMRKIVATSNDASKREAFFRALQDMSKTFVQVLQEQAGIGQIEADYLLKYWFNPNTHDPAIFWPDKQPIEPIVRQGLIKALDVAIQRNVPTDYYWISISSKFQAYVAAGAHQVTHFIFSPPPASLQTGSATTEASIWSIEAGSGVETPGQQESGETIEEVLVYTIGVQVPVVTSRLQSPS